jgi:BASS family bile acid:Na+ symporter
MTIVTRAFPALAIISALAGYYQPGFFVPMSTLIVPLLTLVMFSMGLTLTVREFAAVARDPLRVALGTGLQFLLMPLAAFLIGRALSLPAEIVTGLVLVGSCPGGTASNVICYLARGDLALSISLTFVSTLLAVIFTPILTWAYLGQAIDVPVGDMMLSILQIVVIPVGAGLWLNSRFAARLAPLSAVFPAVAVLAIVMIIGIVVALNSDSIAISGIVVFVAVILHNVIGLGSAYGICRLIRCNEKTSRTIAIEVGMQNSGLGVALATEFFTASAALPGAIFSLWHNLSGSVLASWWGRSNAPLELQ